MRHIIFLLVSAFLFQLLPISMPAPAIAASHSPPLIAQSNLFRPRTNSDRRSEKFDVNDISFLWPVPKSTREMDALLTADERTADGSSQIWPKEVFDTVIETAKTVKVTNSNGGENKINFNDSSLSEVFDQQKTWKVAGMRIDPSAPGSSTKLIQTFGSIPQLRLILQPVTVNEVGNVIVHDYTVHLVYNFTKGRSQPAVPDQEKFREIVTDLKTLKANLAARGISTSGKTLGVHPGFSSRSPDFNNELKAFIKKHVSAENLLATAFMGIEPPEPWIFFAMRKQANGFFAQTDAPTLKKGEKAQMLSFLDTRNVSPVPETTNLSAKEGVSTAMLFDGDISSKLASKVFPAKDRPRFQDIPDIIANPERSHFFNTDCVSCHSESARRQDLGIRTSDALFKYQLPAGVSGVDKSLLPVDLWNVRNFGWFPPFPRSRGDAVETVTMRTANETAEAVEFINHEYLSNLSLNKSVKNAVAKDNGIGGAHLRQQPLQLSSLAKGDFCELEPGETVGIDTIKSIENGFAKVNVVLPNSACPTFKGEKFIFEKHFDLEPITKAVAKSNGINGAHLRSKPLQLSQLKSDESCLLNPNQSIGVNEVQVMKDGFSKVNVTIPSPSCPTFKGEVFVFNKHFNFD
ncbi:MAG: hypothetical protein AAGC93_27100 [Cyanobacteria bacterium P01_F01_bin.53]